MVGADDATFAKLKPVLAAFCENIIHAGPPGHGIILKLINNFIAQAICTATAEACAAAAKSGLSIKKLHEVISAGAVNSGPVPDARRQDARERRPDRAQVHAVERDEGPALLHALHRVADAAVDRSARPCTRASSPRTLLGFGDKYVASLIEAQEKLGGVTIVTSAEQPAVDATHARRPAMRRTDYLEFAYRTAVDGGRSRSLPHFRVPIAVEDKGGGDYDPVTVADRAAEAVIRAAIAQAFPGPRHPRRGARPRARAARRTRG